MSQYEPADLTAEQVRAITGRAWLDAVICFYEDDREYHKPSTRLSVRGDDENRLDPVRLLMRLPVWLRYALLAVVAAGLAWEIK